MESDVGTPTKKAKLDSAMAATSPPKRICTSLNTFKDHREPHMAYVDKTALVARIVSRSAEKGYFVNRPRKFGKTVLLDTIATYFKGDREAFRGLAIYDMQMPWEEFPIIRFSMNALRVRSADQFEANLCSSVLRKAKSHDVCLTSPNSSDSTLLFENLIEEVYEKHQKGVVILIDEYDAPILQCLNKENAELGKDIEEILASFYGVLKSSSSHGYVRFRYMTGITRLVKDTLGSSLNDLSSIDDTSPQLASLCGFTHDEIKSTFGPELSEFARKAKKCEDEAMKGIEDRYNGYNWHLFGDKAGLVFNPYAILCVFKCKALGVYWAEEYLPKWLKGFLNRCDFFETASIIGGLVPMRGRQRSITELLQSLDLDSVRLIMWECGLLTAEFTAEFTSEDDAEDAAGMCRFPNNEVASVVWKNVLNNMKEAKSKEAIELHSGAERMVEFLMADDIKGFVAEIKSLINKVPNVSLANASVDVRCYEAFYHAVMFTVLYMLRVNVKKLHWFTEKTGAGGRIDFMIASKTTVYLIELKCNGNLDRALQQIKDKRYTESPDLDGLYKHHQIKLVAVSFTFQRGDGVVGVVPKVEDYERKR